jgi:hypothetical protein
MDKQSADIIVPSEDPKKKNKEEKDTSDKTDGPAKPTKDAKDGEELVSYIPCSYNVVFMYVNSQKKINYSRASWKCWLNV